MRLKSLSITGFRGFNSTRELVFHDHLTLIAAPNSYGKTSIAEALEFLLFGMTSKVDNADSKEEYKDSYRNRHFRQGQPTVIEAVLTGAESTGITLRRELFDDGSTKLFVDSKSVDAWPFEEALHGSATPFVVQHALKALLLVPPQERFLGFARILGLNEVDARYRAIVSLCTKPEVSLPADATKYLNGLSQVESEVAAIPTLKGVALALKKGADGFDDALAKARSRAKALTGADGEGNLVVELAKKRDELAKQVYSGDPSIHTLQSTEATAQLRQQALIDALAAPAFMDAVVALATQDALGRLQEEADFLEIGIHYLSNDPTRCPLCGLRDENGTLGDHLRARHAAVLKGLGAPADKAPRDTLVKRLTDARGALNNNWSFLRPRTSALIDVLKDENAAQIQNLLRKDETGAADTLLRSATAVRDAETEVVGTRDAASTALSACEAALHAKSEQIADAEAVVSAIQKHIASLKNWEAVVMANSPQVLAAAETLRRAIDSRAGTAELATLSRLLEKPAYVRRAIRLKDLLADLKGLKGHAQQCLGEVMEAAFDEHLSAAVMRWYNMIRTKGDPDVHFSGFAMEKTKTGDYKNARVGIAAESYGVPLASAVSSLSESKLNALGLCVSIATATDGRGPCTFIVLDDPIQSWDADHEQQFISLVRALVEVERRQVILLSHREGWINVVADGCQSMGGIRYSMAGYDKDGPQIAERTWMPVDERLKGIFRVATDVSSSVLDLQQAEADTRVAVCDLTAQATKRRLKRDRDASKLNKKDTRSLLVEMGCPKGLTDRVVATFGITDDAHHVPNEYEPNRERLRQFHGALLDLKNWCESNV